ncbi:hypothetical protein ABZ793_06945 [Micromonospora sp. NPDC047465]|uniref:hypothetical protein n=1 Tax=Micromonospora sp. NPDC047465 TaxID=3154813 RepID=UPI0033E00D60
MTKNFEPPGERDLPPRVANRMRADVLRAVRRPATRRIRPRFAVGLTALAVVAAGFAVRAPSDVETVEVLAMGYGELSPTLRAAARQCLEWGPQDGQVQPTMADLAMAAERGDGAVVFFLTDTGYVTCEVNRAAGAEVSGARSVDRWPSHDLLPGPVQRLLLTSAQRSGGDVTVSGRVSSRVARLVLEHGDGKTTAARISGGIFAVMTVGADLDQDGPHLVSYDAAGTEIDRRRLFQPSNEFEHCYVDPAGTVVYGRPGGDCRPAEPWGR